MPFASLLKPREHSGRLTRHKISDRWRGRPSLQVEGGSHRKLERGRPAVRCIAWLDFMPLLAYEQVQLPYIETGVAIIFPSQFQSGKSVLEGSKGTVHWLV